MTNVRPHSLQAGFTLVELTVAIAVLAIILVAASQIVSTAGKLTTVNNKHMDANDQARMVFDRMADDFARIVRRKDVDYIFWKGGTTYTPNPYLTRPTTRCTSILKEPVISTLRHLPHPHFRQCHK